MKYSVLRIGFLCLLLSIATTSAFATFEICGITHPTPSNPSGSICISAEGDAGPYVITVTDPSGNEICSYSTMSGSFDCDASGEGTYQITISYEGGCESYLSATLIEVNSCDVMPAVVDIKHVARCCDCINTSGSPCATTGCTSDGAITITTNSQLSYICWIQKQECQKKIYNSIESPS